MANTITWVGSEQSFYDVQEAVERAENASDSVRMEVRKHEDEEKEGEHFLLEIQENIGIVQVNGQMVPGVAGFWGQVFGYVGYDDIRNALVTAADQGVSDILMVWNTPGGSLNGLNGLSSFMLELGKTIPITSFSDSQVASGGIWLATASNHFFAEKMAQIGSIGVIAVVKEVTEQLKDHGISVRVFKSTELKASGNPFEKLDAKNAKEIQKHVMEAHSFFVEAVATHTGLPLDFVAAEIATGQMWFAAEALNKGLIDGIKSFDEVFLALTEKTSNNTTNYQFIEVNKMGDKKTIATKVPGGTATEGEGIINEAVEGTATLGAKGQAAIASGASPDKVIEAAVGTDPVITTTAGPEGEGALIQSETTLEVVSSDLELTKELMNRIQTLTEANAELKAALKTSETETESLIKAETSLKQVVAEATQRAYASLGGYVPDIDTLNSMGTGALLDNYKQAIAQVFKHYPASMVTAPASDEDDEATLAAAQKVTAILEQRALQQSRIGSKGES